MAKSKQEILQSINEMAAESYYNLREYSFKVNGDPFPSDWEHKTFKYDSINEDDDIILNENLSLDDKKECMTMFKAAGEFVGTWGWEQFFRYENEEDIYDDDVYGALYYTILSYFDEIKSAIEECREAENELDMYGGDYSDVILEKAERGELDEYDWASELIQAVKTKNMAIEIRLFAEENGKRIWKRNRETGEFKYNI